MKIFLAIIVFLFLNTYSVKANPWLVIEGIGLGVQILEAGAEKLKDINKNRKDKKKQKKQKFNLKESSKIITFSNCTGLEPNYVSNSVFKIDLENQYIKVDEGGKNKLIYFRINNIENLKIISNEAFSPNAKDQKNLDELNKYVDITQTFDVKDKTIKVIVLLEPNAPKKLKKDFAKDIQKGKLAHKTNANCYVTGSNYLIKKNNEQKSNANQNNEVAEWVAIVKHKKKNTKYTSDNSVEINTKQKAINNAKSKCWFDPKHVVGDWPYSNCIVVSAESTSVKLKNEAIRKAKEAKYKAKKEANAKWISENKQEYLDKFKDKLNEFDNNITALKAKREKLKNNLDTLEDFYTETEQEYNITINKIINIDNQELINLLKALRKNTKQYLSERNLQNYKERFKKLEQVNFENYTNYKILKELIKNAENSSNVKDFVGKNGLKINGFTFIGNKIGFIDEFRNLSNTGLGSAFKLDQKNLQQLFNLIDNNTQNINNYILNQINDLKILEAKISKRNFYLNFVKQNPFYKFYYLVNTFVQIIK